MTAAAGSISFYLDDFTDEVLPCGTSLEEWAAWLSRPDKAWGRLEPAADRSTFSASRICWAGDVIATRQDDGRFTLSREIDGEPSVIAVRFGPSLGWSPDSIVCSACELIAFLEDPENDAENEEHIAVGYDEPDVVLLYLADPPRLIIQGVKQ